MKQFFKFTFASCLGFILSAFVLFFLFIFMIASIASSGDSPEPVNIKDNTVLQMKLNYPISERTIENPFAFYDPIGSQYENTLGFSDIVKALNAAKQDSKIKGIFLDISGAYAGMAHLEEIRNAMIDFKANGKFIYAYSEYYTQGMYYLASTADSVYLNPKGFLFFNGLNNEQVYYKGLFEKLDIEIDLIRPKDNIYKSFGEPFIRKNMSDDNREQVKYFLDGLYNHYLNNISNDRNINPDELFKIANELKIKQAEDGVKYNLIDELLYRDQVIEKIKNALETPKKPYFVDFQKYAKQKHGYKRGSEKIAIVYANGDITSGKGNDEIIGSERISKAIKDARENKKVKAIVLRINSPGGSALASDVIWREIQLAKAEKPVVVSIGNVCASGGYYLAIPADKIIAQPNSIVGSIGVFGMLPYTEKFFENKLGITYDRVNTAKYADLGNPNRPKTEAEKVFFQNNVDAIYTDFVGLVSDGRNLSVDSVRNLARGRVYTAVQALELDLIDDLGSFEDAIITAAELAELDDFGIREYPKPIDPVEELINTFASTAKSNVIKKELGSDYIHLKKMRELFEQDQVLMRMEYDFRIK